MTAPTAHVQRDYALKHQLKKLVSEKARPSRAGIDAAPTTATGQMRWNSEVGRGKDRTGDITTCVSKVTNWDLFDCCVAFGLAFSGVAMAYLISSESVKSTPTRGHGLGFFKRERIRNRHGRFGDGGLGKAPGTHTLSRELF